MLKLRWMASVEEAEFWSLSPALKCNGRVGKCPCVWFQNHYSWFAKQLLHDCQKQVKLGCNQWQVNVAQLPLTLELKQTFNQLWYYGTNVLPSPPFIFIPDFSKHGAYYQSMICHISLFHVCLPKPCRKNQIVLQLVNSPWNCKHIDVSLDTDLDDE